MKIYMFRTVRLSIIRCLCIVHSAMVYVIRVCRQLSSRSISSGTQGRGFKPGRSRWIFTNVIVHQPDHNNKQRKYSDTIRDNHITIVIRWAAPIPWIPTKINCYPSHNYKQHSPISNNCSSNIINYPTLLPIIS
jgi:hypothetical protein